jgi:putative ABC transport system permease protein
VRAKEIGIRKVIGAQRKNLIHQFLGESILLSFISLCFSLILVERLLPVFNDLSKKNISLSAFMNPEIILYLLGITLLTGILSGIYPAFFLSSFKPISILKGSKMSGFSQIRKFFVVFQFSLSVVMIMSTLVISNQLTYLNDKNLGFNKDHILYIPLNQALSSKTTLLKNELKKNPQIHQVSLTSNKIGISKFHSIDLNRWEGNIEEKSILLGFIYTDYDFLNTFDIKMSSGRFYSENFASDSLAIVLNESAINEMGLKEPIAKKIFGNLHIIGVVKDFNFQSLHSAIGPLAIRMNQKWNRYLAIKIAGTKIEESINYVESVFKKFASDFPFEYHFLDQQFEKLYRSEQQLGKLFLSFSILAILISALGLLGLASFMAGQRTKEIGIRKVLGASVTSILILLSKEFMKWIVLANVIAWPVAWYIMSGWLENFTYRIDIGWLVFIFSGGISLIIALVTVVTQAVKASNANPVKSLRYE